MLGDILLLENKEPWGTIKDTEKCFSIVRDPRCSLCSLIISAYALSLY